MGYDMDTDNRSRILFDSTHHRFGKADVVVRICVGLQVETIFAFAALLHLHLPNKVRS